MQHAARTSCIASILLLVVVALGVAGSSSAAAQPPPLPTLELDGSWFRIVRPYRYVEERRYERGWNRGADVRIAAGRMRSPVAGVVRFAGHVAGRAVVTVTTRLDGRAAVFTVTGLDTVYVQEGARVGIGDVLGRGATAHVGAYDPERRSRYLPVVGARSEEAAAASADGARQRVRRSPIAEGVAHRLHELILGRITWPAPAGRALRNVVQGRRLAPRGASVVAAAPSSDAQQATTTARAVAMGAPAPGIAVAPGAWAAVAPAPGRTARAGGHHVGQLRSSSRGPAVMPRAGAGGEDLAGRGPTAGFVGDRAVTASGRPGVGVDRSPLPRHRRGVSVRAGRPSGAAGVEAVPAAGSDHAATDGIPATRVAGGASRPELIVTALLVLLLIAAAVGLLRSRRRRPRTAPSVVHAPLPTHLPHVRPYAYPVVRSDGSSVLPDIALAWPDRESGTSPDTEPHAHARQRAPEHA